MSLLTVVATLIREELVRSTQRGQDWRRTVMRKPVYLVDRDLQPTPDGSSADYLGLASFLADRDQLARASAPDDDSVLLKGIDAVVQNTVLRALRSERALAERER